MTNLNAALNVAAPDGGAWIEGNKAYYDKLAEGASEQEALEAALNAAAPDGGSWLEGQRVFWLTPNQLEAHNLGLHESDVPPSRLSTLTQRAKANFKTLVTKTKRPTSNTKGHS